MTMKTFFTKHLALLVIFGVISITSFAQIGLKQIKDKVVKTDEKIDDIIPDKITNTENVDGNISSDNQSPCDYTANSGQNVIDDLENNLRLANNYLDEKEYDLAERRIEYLDRDISDIKSNCPNFDVAPYEEQIAEFKTKLNHAQTEAEANEISAANDQEILDKAGLLLSYITDYSLHLGNDPVFAAKQFYDKCKETDYLNYRKSLDAVMAKSPELKAKAEEPYGADTRLNKDYEQFISSANESYIPEINRVIEEGYAEKAAKRMDNARQKAQAVVICSDALLLIAPDNVDFQTLKKDAQVLLDAINKELALTVYTSTYHGENVEKFVFSKSPIVIKSENPANMTNAFVAGDYIYAMAYLTDKINAIAYNSDVRLVIYVDGSNKYSRKFSLYSQKDLTAFDFEIVPDPATSVQQGCVEYARELSTLSPRNHKIKFELNDDGGTILAEGEFTLDCTQGMDKLTKIAQDLRAKQLEKVRLPSGGALNTAALQQQTMKLWNGDETPLRALITSDDWETHRNEYSGVIEYRDAWTAIAVKRTDGTCAIFYMAIRQDYNGSAYGSTIFGAMGDNEEISCENVNK